MVSSFTAALPAGATSWHLFPNGQVIVLSSSLGSLTTPVDGRLRGPDFQVTVTGVSWPASANGYVPNSGHRLVSFDVALTEGTNASTTTETATNLSLVVNGDPTALNTTNIESSVSQSQGSRGTGTSAYLASVPNDTKNLQLVASDSSFSQSFSLWSLKRTSSAPSVLYADPVNSSLTDSVNRTFNVPITNPADGVRLNSVLDIASAHLSAFNNDGINTPAPTGKAFMTLTMSSGPPQLNYPAPNWGHFFSGMQPFPGSAVTFTPKGGVPVSAVMTNPVDQTNNVNATSDDGLVDATYSLLVPDTTTTGTLTFHPFVTNGVEYTGFGGSPGTTPLRVGGPTSLALTFPVATALPRQPTPSWVSEPIPATGIPGSGGIGGGSGISVWVAVIALAGIGGGVAYWRRRNPSRATVVATAPVIEDPPPSETVVPGPQPQAEAESEATVPEVGPLIDEVNDDLLRIDFFGPLTITPLASSAPDPVRAIYSYLSFQEGRQRSGDTIQTMLWPLNANDRDVSKKTLTNYMSNARALVGVEHLPEAKGQRGYELLRYTTDWIEFQRYVADAADSPEDVAYKLHHDALALVRGSLFEGEESSYFDFVRDEGYERVIQNTVSKVAHEHFREAMLNGDLDEAEWAARQGLKIDPRDTTLWADLTDVIARRGNDPELERHFAHAEGALGPEVAQQFRDRLNA